MKIQVRIPVVITFEVKLNRRGDEYARFGQVQSAFSDVQRHIERAVEALDLEECYDFSFESEGHLVEGPEEFVDWIL